MESIDCHKKCGNQVVPSCESMRSRFFIHVEFDLMRTALIDMIDDIITKTEEEAEVDVSEKAEVDHSVDTFLEEVDEEEEEEVRRIEEEERSVHKDFTNDIVGKWEELYLKVTGRSGFSQSEKFVEDRNQRWDEEEESAKKIVEGVQRRIESNKRQREQKEKQLITSYFTKRKNDNGLAAWASKTKKPKTINSKKRFSFKFMSQ
jgi:hypothetical protein